MTNLQILKYKSSKYLSIFAIFIVAGFIGVGSLHGKGLIDEIVVGTEVHYNVELRAQGTTHSGTKSTIFFRLYSWDKKAWGAWNSINGVKAGTSKTVKVSEAPGFTDLKFLQIYVGEDDGVRLNPRVTGSSTNLLYGHPFDKWVKNEYFTYNLYDFDF